jgi:DNA-binding transcriptional ArsR family regulator
MISLFSPQRTDPEILERIFVKREALLQAALDRIRDSTFTASKHQLLFIGPRGSGKTHLLSLIAHRVEADPALRASLRVARLNEDESITSFLKLLLRVFEELAYSYPEEFPKEYTASLRGLSQDEALRAVEAEFLARTNGKCVLVLLENLDAILEAMPVLETRRWRAFLQDHPRICTVATAQQLVPAISSQKETFHGFFNIQHLTPFKTQDARLLAKKIAEVKGDSDLSAYLDSAQGNARIAAIHHLTGGSARLYVMFSELCTAQALEELVPAFEKIADQQLTPYYQERFRWISAQQREIVQFLCQQPVAVPVKTIADALFATHGTITSQLKDLREKGYVLADERGREMLYQLAEPLMRLSLQVKDARNQCSLPLIVDFLRVWYNREALEKQQSALSPNTVAAEYVRSALTQESQAPGALRKQLLQVQMDEFDPKTCKTPEDAAQLRAIAQEINSPAAWFHSGYGWCWMKDYQEAIADYSRAIDLPLSPPSQVAKAIHHRAWTWSDLAVSLSAVTDYRALANLNIDSNWDWFGWTRSARNIITHTFLLRSTTPPWEQDAKRFAEFFLKHKKTSELGNALVAHLGELTKLAPTTERMSEWESGWLAAFGSTIEYAAAGRMLTGGIAWLKTRKESALAPLVLEERRIVRSALGLDAA